MRLTLGVCLMVLGLASSGCGYKPARFHGDVTFSPEERAAIERGNQWLTDHAGVDAAVITWDGEHADCSKGECLAQHLYRSEDGVGGLYDGVDGGWVVLGITTGTDFLAPLFAHELGHVYGLKHLPESVHGLMNHWVPARLEWTDADEANCRADGVCE